MEFPTGEYDYCIIGESIFNHYLLASLSNEGYKVLFLDTSQVSKTNLNPLGFDQFCNYASSHNINDSFYGFQLSEVPSFSPPLTPEIELVSASVLSKDPSRATIHDLSVCSKKFSLELCPLTFLANGSTVDRLIEFNMTHFLTVVSPHNSKIYLRETGTLETIPLNKSQVFLSKFLTLEEKYSLSNLMKKCMNLIDFSELRSKNESIDAFFDEFNISQKLRTFLFNSIMREWFKDSPIVSTVSDFLLKVKNYFEAITRFKTTSNFLFSSYGSLDISHSFLRKASLLGAISCYGAMIEKISPSKDDSLFEIRFVTGTCAFSRSIIVDNTHSSLVNLNGSSLKSEFKFKFVSRCILIHPSVSSDKTTESNNNLEIIIIPKDEKILSDVWVIKQPSGSGCPLGLTVAYFMKFQSHDDAKSDLNKAVEIYTESLNVTPLWWCYYIQKCCTLAKSFTYLPDSKGLVVHGTPDSFVSDDIIDLVMVCYSLKADQVLPNLRIERTSPE